MTYRKNIKITISKIEQETINNVLTMLEDIDGDCEMDAFDICNVLDAIREKSTEVPISVFDHIEIEYEE